MQRLDCRLRVRSELTLPLFILFSPQATIVVKYFFQFGFFPFNQNKIDKNRPYHPPNIIGVEKKDGYVHYDLVQLLALFFHRSILKVREYSDSVNLNMFIMG